MNRFYSSENNVTSPKLPFTQDLSILSSRSRKSMRRQSTMTPASRDLQSILWDGAGIRIYFLPASYKVP